MLAQNEHVSDEQIEVLKAPVRRILDFKTLARRFITESLDKAEGFALKAIERFKDLNLQQVISTPIPTRELPVLIDLIPNNTISLEEIRDLFSGEFGEISIEVMTPEAFEASDAIFESGELRAEYLERTKQWEIPTIGGLDVAIQDRFSYAISIYSSKFGLIGSVRIPYPGIPSGDLNLDNSNLLELFRSMEILAAKDLDLDVNHEHSSMQALAESDFAQYIAHSIKKGEFNTIERLVLVDKDRFKREHPGFSYRTYSAIILGLLMAELTAVSINTHVEQSLVQCDMMFSLALGTLLGSEGAVNVVSETTQRKSTGEADPCYTLILDFQRGFQYIKKHNPIFAKYVEARCVDLTRFLMLNYESDAIEQ